MRKQVRLPDSAKNKDKAKAQKPKQDDGGFALFVRDQGTGAGRTWVIILKVLEIILTTIFALMLGIFGPIVIRNGDIVDEEIAKDPSSLWWLLSSCVYILGLFVVMLGRAKTATVIHVIAAAGTLVTYSHYMELFKNVENANGPTVLYMPCLFITLLTIAIMLIINVPKWFKKHLEKINQKAPSILDDK